MVVNISFNDETQVVLPDEYIYIVRLNIVDDTFMSMFFLTIRKNGSIIRPYNGCFFLLMERFFQIICLSAFNIQLDEAKFNFVLTSLK